MKKNTIIFTFFIALTITVNAQWQRTNGPYYGGNVSCLVEKDTSVFAIIESEVYLTTNNGNAWTKVSTNTMGLIETLAVSGNNIFAIGLGIFISSNNGASWTSINNGIPANSSVVSLAVSGTTLYVGTSEGICKSTDNGANWTNVTSFPNTNWINKTIYTLAINGANIYAGTTYGVYLSTDSGASWTAINNIPALSTIKLLTVSGSTIFASDKHTLWKSTNNGSSWTAITNITTISTSIQTIYVNDTNIYVGTTHAGLFRSTDNGLSWISISKGLMSNSVNSIVVNGNNMYAGTLLGIFKSINNGADWDEVNIAIDYATIYSTVVKDSSIFAAAFYKGIYRSTDNGLNWVPVNNGLPAEPCVTRLIVSDNNIYAITSEKGVFLSTNNGVNWSMISNGLPVGSVILSLVANDTNIFVGTANYGIFLSTNNGVSWTAMNNGIPIINSQYTVGNLAISGTNIFANAGGGGIFFSSNNGASWTNVSNGLPNSNYSIMAIRDTNIFVGNSNGQVFLSTNNGTSWSARGSFSSGISSIMNDVSNVYIGVNYAGVRYSNNNGVSWSDLSLGLVSNTFSLVTNGTNIFAGTYEHGVYKRSSFICTPPSIQATAFTTSAITNNSIKIGWTRGNGDSVLVLARLGNVYSNLFFPYDGNSYIANSNFGSASPINSGIYVVYKGIDTSVVITGLAANTSYNFAVFEYNAANFCYLSPSLIGSATTTCVPLVITTQPTHTQTACTPSSGVSFTVAATTGTTPITYQWQYNNGGTWINVINGTPTGALYINGTTPTMSVSGITSAATYQYRCYLTNCSGANNATSDTAFLVVNATPSEAGTIIGTTTVCQEQSLSYTIPSIANATSYVWTLPNGATGTSITNIINVNYGVLAVSGYITVKGYSACGYGVMTSLPITINPVPSINFITTSYILMRCEPFSVSFINASTPPNSSYLWNFGDGQTSTIENPTHIFSVGSYAIGLTVTSPEGCSKSWFSNPNFIISSPIPITPIITKTGNTLTSNATSGNQWYNLSTGIINGANAQSYNPVQIGNYFTIVTINGCQSDSSNIIYYTTGIGENNANLFNVKVFPNPFTDNTTIEYTLAKNENVELSLVDITGQELIKLVNEKQDKGTQTTVLDASKLSKGIYFYQLKIGYQQQKGKLIRY